MIGRPDFSVVDIMATAKRQARGRRGTVFGVRFPRSMPAFPNVHGVPLRSVGV
jgi:hypothetical protein